MKKLLLCLLAVATVASAGPLENMTAQCEYVMAQGACRIALDPNDYPNETILIAGVGRIKTSVYLAMRAPLDAKNADGTYQMCTLIKDLCPAGLNDGTDGCKAVRSLWNANFTR